MKILLTTLNAKYIHTALSLQYLYSYCGKQFEDMVVKEYTINHHREYILAEIYKGEFDVVCFSTYIWNIEGTLEIAKNLKKVNPNQIIVLGGPEVSFDALELMKKNDFIDYIVMGEGEHTFRSLMDYIVNKQGIIKEIEGITYRRQEAIFVNRQRALIENLDEIPSPFEDGVMDYENKIIYYESSRGCPYNCRYCLSSTIKGVRFFSLDRVKRDLDIFLINKVKQVKFVDRTFNAKKSHSLEVMKYIVDRDNEVTNFHFEITADLLDDEVLEFLSTVREGLFQFEVGVQTTYDKTMESIDRKVDFNILSKVVKKISTFKNIHLHLDLIAGLPYEDFHRFKKSFDEVYALKPEKLQMGFLKLLRGSGIREDKDLHGYIFLDEAPYEVLENRYIHFKELLVLKMMEEMVEIYFNSHGFENAIDYILANYYDHPSDFYEALALHWEEKGYHHVSHGKNALYEKLLGFYGEKDFPNQEVFEEILKLDYLMGGRSSLPGCFLSIPMDDFNNRIHKFLQNEQNIEEYLPRYKDIPAKKIIKEVHFQNFKYDILDIIKNPKQKEIHERPTTLLFDYNLDRKIFFKSKYYKVHI